MTTCLGLNCVLRYHPPIPYGGLIVAVLDGLARLAVSSTSLETQLEGREFLSNTV